MRNFIGTAGVFLGFAGLASVAESVAQLHPDFGPGAILEILGVFVTSVVGFAWGLRSLENPVA